MLWLALAFYVNIAVGLTVLIGSVREDDLLSGMVFSALWPMMLLLAPVALLSRRMANKSAERRAAIVDTHPQGGDGEAGSVHG